MPRGGSGLANVAYIPDVESAKRVTGWARLLEGDGDIGEVRYACAADDEVCAQVRAELGDAEVPIHQVQQPQPWQHLLEYVRQEKREGLIAAPGGDWGGNVDRVTTLMRTSPCKTFLDLGGKTEPKDVRRVLVVGTGSAHDVFATRIGTRIAEACGGMATIAAIEQDVGEASRKLGERSLDQMLRDADADRSEHVETKVIVDNHPVRGVLQAFDGHDLVIVGMNDLHLLRTLGKALGNASLAVVKRTPPLRTRQRSSWLPQVSPTDYAVLMQSLRQGSRWNADFVMMLGLASAVASLGLMQNSPAVVIGSMLLAPLMTPMIGFGLALLQANARLARSSGKSIVLGFFLTLLVSTGLGFLDPGDTLSPEVLARGGPNLLDLGIALFAALAAGYAMARPTIGGAVAGVAIATALVPPVCACGISLAGGITGALGGDGTWGVESYDGAFMNALGAALLFVTNLFAIILSSSLVFSLMGISVPRTFSRSRRLARAAIIGLTCGLLLLCIPLAVYLANQMEIGRAQPLGHPVSRAVAQAAVDYTEQDPEVRVMFMARSSIKPLIIVYLATKRTLPEKYIEGLRTRIRTESGDDETDVIIIGVRWSDDADKEAK